MCVCECVRARACMRGVLSGGLELWYELPFTLDDPHDRLDHLGCGALAPDISCVQLQEIKKQKKQTECSDTWSKINPKTKLTESIKI